MSGLDAVRTKSTNLNVAVPVELVQHVDDGKPPDGFTLEMHRRVAQLSEGVRMKQHGLKHLEETISLLASDMMEDQAPMPTAPR